MTKFRKLVSVLLVICVLLLLAPLQVFAASDSDLPPAVTEPEVLPPSDGDSSEAEPVPTEPPDEPMPTEATEAEAPTETAAEPEPTLPDGQPTEAAPNPEPSEAAEPTEPSEESEPEAPTEPETVEEIPEPTEAEPEAESAEERAKREVIDQPWSIVRPITVDADQSFGNGVHGVSMMYLQYNGVQKVCYCIEPGKPITDAGVRVGFTADDEITAWNSLSNAQKNAIALVLAYGYPTVSFDDISTSDASQKYAATQLIMWEIILNARNPSNFIASDQYCGYFSQSRYPVLYSVYNSLSNTLIRHEQYPTFATRYPSQLSSCTYDLTYDAVSGKFVCVLKDTTSDPRYQTLSEYNFTSSIAGLTITRTSATELRIECTAEAAANLPESLTFSAIGKAVTADSSKVITVWEAKGTTDQKLVTNSGARDPVPIYFALRVPTANLEIIKTSLDGKVDGITFVVADSDGNEVARGTTDANGKISLSGLTVGRTYTVTEVVPDGYVCAENNKQITIQGGSNSVSFENIPQKGSVEILKTVNGNPANGFTFRIYKSSPQYSTYAMTTVRSDGSSSYEIYDNGAGFGLGSPLIEVYAKSGTSNNASYLQQCKFTRSSKSLAKITFNGTPPPSGQMIYVVYRTYEGRSNTPDYTVTTTTVDGVKGRVLLKDVDSDTYYVEEIPRTGYEWIGNMRSVSVTQGGIGTVRFNNIPLKTSGEAKIIKTVAGAASEAANGMTFRIYSGVPAQGAYDCATRTANGAASFTLYDDEFGFESIIEVYVGDVTYAGHYTVSRPSRWECTVTLDSIPPNGSTVNIVYQSGANFSADYTVTTETTDGVNGIGLLEGLPAGTYYIEEVPRSGYKWVGTGKTVVISAGSTATVAFDNIPLISPALKIVKHSEDGNVAGIGFEIYTEAGYSSGTVWQTVITAADGTVQLDGLLPGNYWIREIVPDGYVAQADQRIEVTAENGADNPAIVTFTNRLNPTLRVVKQSEDGVVAGITFLVYTEAGYSDGAAWKTITTDADGKAQIDHLPAGIYWIREIVPDGYMPQADQRVEVTAENTLENPAIVRFENRLLRGTITIHKVSTGGGSLAGATFLLEYSKDGVTWAAVQPATSGNSGIGTCVGVAADGIITTGSDGKAVFSDLIISGVMYRLTETKAPAGYQLLAEPVFVGSITGEQNYKLTYTVVNIPLLQMPPAGGSGFLWTFGAAASGLCVSLALLVLVLLMRRKKSAT